MKDANSSILQLPYFRIILFIWHEDFSFQVVSHNEAPAFLGNGESLETSFSFELNDMMTVPSTVDQRGSNV